MKTLIALIALTCLSGCELVETQTQASATPANLAAIHVAIADAQAEVQRESRPDLPEIGEGASEVPPLSELMNNYSEAIEELALAPEAPEIEPEATLHVAIQSYEPTPSPRLHTDDGYLTPAGVVAWLDQNGHRDHWSYPGGNDTVNEHISHMVSTHGWESWQLQGLTYQQLEKLHSADHDNLIGPRSRIEEIAMASEATEAPPVETDACIPIRYNEADQKFYWTYGGREFRWESLEEGLTYGGRFLYRDGCMHYVGAAEQTVPPVVIRNTSGVSSSNCPGGRCNLPRYSYRPNGGRRYR